ncbi:hypothetical protein SAMN05443248_0872 [Bradyrhizobium erythrophlei]|uniref:Uncharacterized protein n=1 Tax=Bradyrhizobium erythrophlei TaxID=1437360 RepID=A0A1M5I9H0_9BRAD|nr:hypothetical protein SAMN05443248_0872 [Bradyrhizobium erythrophlei]
MTGSTTKPSGFSRALYSSVASSFETHGFAMLLRMRSETLMVRSAATPRVSNHQARWVPDGGSTQLENALDIGKVAVAPLHYPSSLISRNTASIEVKNMVKSMTATAISRKSWMRQIWPAASATSPACPISQGVRCVSPENA